MSDSISSPDSLPAGWTMEVRTRKTGHKDRYFTDPVSGYVFRSFKEVDRYLKTGKVGKLAIKLKEKAREDKSSSEQKLADSDGKIDGNQNSEVVEGVKDEQISESVGTADCTSLSEQAIDQCKEGPAVSEVNQAEAEGMEQTEEGNSTPTANTVVSASPVIISALPENQPPIENGSKRQGNIWCGTTKRPNDKRDTEEYAPRRASKRLAGVKLDPVPDIKTTTRTRRGVAAATQSAEPETTSPGQNSGEFVTSSENPPLNAETENMPDEQPIVPEPDERAVLVEINNKDAAKPGFPPATMNHPWSPKAAMNPPGSPQTTVKPGSPHAALKPPESPLYLSMTNLWTNDPCMEFAVKTLTGDIPIVGDGNGDTVPVGNENMNVNKTTNETLVGSPLDLSFGDLWSTDPCIEFAVKTLTGTFPSEGEEEISIQDYYFQQNIGGSKQTGGGGDASVDTFCQTELLSQHFEDPDMSLFEQQQEEDQVAPGLLRTQNLTLQNNAADGGLNQHVADAKGGEHPGPSVC